MAFEPGAQGQDAAAELARGAIFGPEVAARAIGEVHAEQTLAFGTMKPFVSGAGADAEARGDGAKGRSAAECGNDAATLEELVAFFDMKTEPRGGWADRQAVAAPAALRLRSGSLRSPPLRRNAAGAPASTPIKCLPFPVTRPFTISCHLPPNAFR